MNNQTGTKFSSNLWEGNDSKPLLKTIRNLGKKI